MRRTKIVCTLGPSSASADVIEALVLAGMNVARLNFSHGSHEDHRALHTLVREAAVKLGKTVAVLGDLQGPKMRTGRLVDGAPITLLDGQMLTITTEDVPGTPELISTTYALLAQDVSPGDRILLDDGNIELRVEEVSPPHVRCHVVYGGELRQNKGLNLPGVAVSAPTMTEKDKEDLAFALDLGIDCIALSFVRSAEDLRLLKHQINLTGNETRVIAKIERPEALANLEEILDLADGVMVARGDLGVEVALKQVPQIQKDLIRRCNLRGIPVITATQMLESMITNPRPTRAEVVDVANAIYDGTDALMLSGETAVGRFPVRAVQTMAQVAEEADIHAVKTAYGSLRNLGPQSERSHRLFSEAIGHAVSYLSETLHVKRIVCFTRSGYTAMQIARYRPDIPITAFAGTDATRRWCTLIWGVDAVTQVEFHDLDEMAALFDELLLERGLAERGDVIILVGSTPLAIAGRTNFMKIHTVGESA
ncbi:MAG: pyruvate kinase [Candidatus Hydrogenedentes bacterium]|nr:pyruvate kinase [Candidatus Hydrogenedentota bacterium]